jgi:hypothetical protein
MSNSEKQKILWRMTDYLIFSLMQLYSLRRGVIQKRCYFWWHKNNIAKLFSANTNNSKLMLWLLIQVIATIRQSVCWKQEPFIWLLLLTSVLRHILTQDLLSVYITVWWLAILLFRLEPRCRTRAMNL